MTDYRVPRRTVSTRILLDDGRALDCVVFTATTGPDGGVQSVLDKLNDPGEDFLAVACGDDRFLVNRSGIMTVQVADTHEIEALVTESGEDAPVRVSLTGGISLVGRFRISMPPERSRVLDYLNGAPRFVPLLGDNRVTLVQRSYIVSVRSGD